MSRQSGSSGGKSLIPSRSGAAPTSAYSQTMKNIDGPLRTSRKNLLRSPSFSSLAAKNVTIEPLPPLKSAAPQDRIHLFKKKLKMCSVVFNFTDPQSEVQGKEIKRQTLTELLDYINTMRGVLVEAVFPDIAHMIAANLFRTLPAPAFAPDEEGFDPEEDEPVLEEAWPHLQLVFEFLLRFVISPDVDAKIAKRYFDSKFILQLMELFDSEDPRERDYLKTILHRIYSKFMQHRGFIRKNINDILFRVIYEVDHHHGIAELLEIFGSIINGFVQPIKSEHKHFLVRCLLPLHKTRCYPLFHEQLAYCVTQFVEKSQALCEPVIFGLLKFWPQTNSPKEVLFINEVENILELLRPQTFQQIQVPLFKRLAQCVNSMNFQVAERALLLWNNEYIVNLVAQSAHVVMPIMFGPLYRNSKSHWNSTVHGLTYNVLKLFMELNPKLFDECAIQFKVASDAKRAAEQKRIERWAAVEEQARRNAAKQRSDKKIEKTLKRDISTHVLVEVDKDDVKNADEILAATRRVAEKPKNPPPAKQTRVRRKSILPQDVTMVNALKSHTPLDERDRR